jgi:phosphocarrier protein HPr
MGEKAMKKQFKIIPSTGFARPATLLVSSARKYTSKICLEYQGRCINLKKSPDQSLREVMLLGIKPGSNFIIWAKGIDEHQAIESIEEQLSNKNLLTH